MSDQDPHSRAARGARGPLAEGASTYLEHVMTGHRWQIEGSAQPQPRRASEETDRSRH